MSEVPLYSDGCREKRRHCPLSSELGTLETVKATFWLWREPFFRWETVK